MEKQGQGKAAASASKAGGGAEKRLKRHRSRPTQKILQRIERALSQRLFLVHTSEIHDNHPQHGGPYCELAVLGSTGNLYTVTLSKVPHCNCPDHAKGNLCKHLLFVSLKVVGLRSTSNLVYQDALLTAELDEIFCRMQQRREVLTGGATSSEVVANQSVRDTYDRMTGKMTEESDGIEGGNLKDDGSDKTEGDYEIQRKPIEGDCAICFDPLGEESGGLTFCRLTCGTNFHSQCVRMWTTQQKASGGTKMVATCPACRQPWTDVATGGVDPKAAQSSPSRKRKADEGYVNLGELQGQSPERDTSTYYSYSPDYGRRRRRRDWW